MVLKTHNSTSSTAPPLRGALKRRSRQCSSLVLWAMLVNISALLVMSSLTWASTTSTTPAEALLLLARWRYDLRVDQLGLWIIWYAMPMVGTPTFMPYVHDVLVRV